MSSLSLHQLSSDSVSIQSVWGSTSLSVTIFALETLSNFQGKEPIELFASLYCKSTVTIPLPPHQCDMSIISSLSLNIGKVK